MRSVQFTRSTSVMSVLKSVNSSTVGNFTLYVCLMACSSTRCCSTVFTCWTSQHLCIRLVTLQAYGRLVVLTAVFPSIQVLDMTQCSWVGNSQRTFENHSRNDTLSYPRPEFSDRYVRSARNVLRLAETRVVTSSL
jgi:hypothetical protein